MKIRRSFDVPLQFLSKKKSTFATSVVPIIYQRSRHIVDTLFATDIKERKTTLGSLFNIRYIHPSSWWVELTTGFEREHGTLTGTTSFKRSVVGCDDIVLSSGFNLLRNKDMQIILFGLAGFPTNRKVTIFDAQDTFVGTRFYSAGVGSEFSYSFVNLLKKSFVMIFQNRFLHFFSRKWDPILPVGGRIQPGNVIDILFAARYRFKTNIVEGGYNGTFFTNQALIFPTRKIESDNFLRNSIFASYTRGFLKLPLLNTPGAIGTGILLSRLKRFNTKIFSWWVNFSVVF